MADPLHLYDVDADGNPVIIIPPTATTPSVVIPTSDPPPGVVIGQPSTGGGGVTDHSLLSGRSTPDQHPISAVTGLTSALAGKVDDADARLSDARTPTAHKSTHGTGGTDEIAPADIGAATTSHTHAQSDVTGLVADLAGKVGTGDSRLSDARTPTAHALSHATGGTDQVTPAAIGARPAGNVPWSEIDNKPSIPAAQVNSDWTASSGVAQILHKPTIPSAPADIGAAPVSHVHGAADVTSGVIAPARLGTGSPDGSKVLKGDGTWGAAGGKDWAVSAPPTSSHFQGTGRANATQAVWVGVGTMLLVPFKMLPFSYTAMVIRVAVGGGAGEIVRLGVYERLDDGSCGGLLVDAGTVTVNSGGVKTATMPPFTPSDPNVYLAFVPQGPTNTATFFAQNNNAPVLSTGLMGNFENQGLFVVTGVTGALPADPTATVVGGFGVPIIGLY